MSPGRAAVHCSELLKKPVGSKAKTSFLQRKDLRAVTCSPFGVKMASGTDKTATTRPSMLIFTASARLTVTSCLPSSSCPVAFTGSFQRLFPTLITTKRMLTGYAGTEITSELRKMDVHDFVIEMLAIQLHRKVTRMSAHLKQFYVNRISAGLQIGSSSSSLRLHSKSLGARM